MKVNSVNQNNFIPNSAATISNDKQLVEHQCNFENAQEINEQEKHSPALVVLDSINRAGISLSNIFSKTKYEETEKIINKIVEPKGMKVSRYINDDRILIGRPIQSFKNICRDDMRAKCKRSKDGKIYEIYLTDISDKMIGVYDAEGKIKKIYNESDIAALTEYKYHSEYIHYLLRENKLVGDTTKDKLETYISTLDKMFANNKKHWKTKEPMTLYRAIDDDCLQQNEDILEQIGGVFKSSSFISSTKKYSIAKRFSSCGTNPILEIEVPVGTKYIDMDSLFNIKTNFWKEQEFLLPRNSMFMVTGYNYSKNIIKVKYLGVDNKKNCIKNTQEKKVS